MLEGFFLTRTGIEQHDPAQQGKQQPSGLLLSARVPICRNVKKRWKSLNPYEESKEHGRPQAVKKSPVGSFLVFGFQPIGMSTVVAALLEGFFFDPYGNRTARPCAAG